MYTWNTQVNILTVLVVFWTLAWKCYSVWIAAGRKDKKWFVGLIIFNTIGILDIIYVFFIAKKTWPEVVHSVKSLFRKKQTESVSTPE